MRLKITRYLLLTVVGGLFAVPMASAQDDAPLDLDLPTLESPKEIDGIGQPIPSLQGGGQLAGQADEGALMYYPPQELFYNYYAPNSPTGVSANLYLCPRPVPPHVGHTYYTYQPFYPHEWMYPHWREYYNYHSVAKDKCGFNAYNHTEVTWKRGHLQPTYFRLLNSGRAPHRQMYQQMRQAVRASAGY